MSKEQRIAILDLIRQGWGLGKPLSASGIGYSTKEEKFIVFKRLATIRAERSRLLKNK